MSHIYFNTNQGDHPHEVVEDVVLGRKKEIHDLKFTILKSYDHQYGHDHHNNTTRSSSSSAKSESPKRRLYQKFMMSKDDDQTIEVQNSKQDDSPRESCGENNANNSCVLVRSCSDCSTTKTPLWRSGPHGPKSLCNACGIRQRKARRAAMASSDTPCATNSNNNNTSTTTATTKKLNNNLLHHTNEIVVPKMKKRSKNRHKRPSFSPHIIDHHHHQTKKICFREFACNLSNKSSLHQIFPQDEKEAAILLMALSCGFVEG